MKIPELSVVIPFYNEEGNAEVVIMDLEKTLRKKGVDYEIVAVNNGSFDRTGPILENLKSSRMRIVTIKNNIGFGYGILKGLEAAKGKYVGYMWGDNQIPSEVVGEVFSKLLKEDLDLCKIRRTARDYGFFRKLESGAYNRIFMVTLFGKISYDINGSPKIMKRRLYERMNLKSKDWFIDTEVMGKAKRLGARIGEIEVVYNKRGKGKSKVKFYVAMEFLKNLVKFRLNGFKNLQQ